MGEFLLVPGTYLEDHPSYYAVNKDGDWFRPLSVVILLENGLLTPLMPYK